MELLRQKKVLAVAGLLVLMAACAEPGPEATATETPPAHSPTPAPVVKSQVPRYPAPYTPTELPPKLDTSVASVALDDIVFDTFSGGHIRLSKATDEVVERLRDAIKPIYEPRYDPVDGGNWLRDDDIVIGYAAQSGAYAYPVKILNLHEIVNDVIDGTPVLVSYCPLCASAVVYERELDGRVLLFGNTSALYESDMVMYDHETGSYWFQVLGEAIVGPLTGKRLTMLPSVTIPWGEWKRQHPGTRVLSRNLGLLRGPSANPYDRDPFAGYDKIINRGRFSFPVSEDKLDGRLRPGDRVIAVQLGESHKAYALSNDSDWLLNDEVGGEGVVLIGRARGPSAVAYLSRAGGRDLSFRLVDGAMQDVETGSAWDDSGLVTSGPMAGIRLTAVPSRTSFWFSVAGALPGIELYKPE